MSAHQSTKTKIAKLLTVVCFCFAIIFGITTHLFVTHGFKVTTTTQATEATKQLDHLINPNHIDQPHAHAEIVQTLENIVTYGIFEAITIYDTHNHKIAQAATTHGKLVKEKYSKELLQTTKDTELSYKEFIKDDLHVLSIKGPIKQADSKDQIVGHFEVIRIIPEWRKQQILTIDIWAISLTIIGALSIGLLLYPIIVRLNDENYMKHREVVKSHIHMIKALGEAVAKRDSKTGIHSNRVTLIAVKIAETMGIDKKLLNNLIIGCLLHDIGKIGITDSILLKPGKLTPEETEIMHGHVVKGEEIINNNGWLENARDVISGHHEKWDGTGYPRGLSGKNIPLIARIAAISDVFDVLCTTRPYKLPYSYETAIDMMVNESGKHFDPEILMSFLPISKELYDLLMTSSGPEISRLLDEKIQKYITV